MRDTIDIAREAGLTAPEGYQGTGWFWGHDNLKAFEALVRADERSVEREQAEERKSARSAWVGLTDKEILDKCEVVPDFDIGNYDLIEFARAIEAKLKEKNSD